MKTLAMCALSAVITAWSFQDPPAPPRQDPPPAAQEPQESKEPKGLPERDPLEGVYVLTGRQVAGHPDPNPSHGYLAITHRHIFLTFAGAGPDPDYPLLRAGVRKWTRKGDKQSTVDGVVQLGFFTDGDAEVHIEQPGTREPRRIDLLRGGLRVWQDDQSFLDFERVE